jgi:hypothetical protein
MRTNKIHWFSLLTLVVLGLGASSTLLMALGIGVNSLIGLFTEEGDPAGQMITAFAFGFEGALLLVCSWFVLQKTMGREQAEFPFKFPYSNWQIVSVIGTIVVSAGIGGVIAYSKTAWLSWIMLPILTVLVIVPPILLFLAIGANGIEPGPRWRVFSTLGLSLTLSPLIIVAAEVVLLLGVIIASSIVIAIQQPALVQEVAKLGRILQSETSEDAILKLLAPYISSPSVIALLVGFMAVVVPLVEELFKPLAVWIFARKIESPAQGFVMGLLSGAAFALIESLNASGDGTMTWPVVVSVRAGTSLLHIMASGLVGWGIVSAFREKRIMRFFAAYFSAATIHGVWNACAIGLGLSLVGEVIGKPEWFYNVIPAMLGGMIVLGVGIFLVLIASNRKLRILSPPVLPALREEVQ